MFKIINYKVIPMVNFEMYKVSQKIANELWYMKIIFLQKFIQHFKLIFIQK